MHDAVLDVQSARLLAVAGRGTTCDCLAGQEFVPATMKSTKTQAWIQIYKFPLEYWRPRAIFSIIRGLGTPFSLDESTMKKNRGMFARILVDIDMLSPLPDHIWVERPNYTFVAGVEYEWLPPFCSVSGDS
ncbi:hypothetical protein PHAVU_002G144100 [Phaseolus vulgaris]|uniref:Uncharacterized protein n=1 Tax=Phaseolus vulgaris TaxID=3885 RepID=V7CJH6_PHAVU|nr:hypothetical protein PHAVU_002G144100g [Phaseolus vulgaris]ESW30332.1 hypothetical protein PHAVU_002G144100g [Phaseolus vulgaris]